MATSVDIEAIKEAYILTQAKLIESCEAHNELIEWWKRTKQ